MKNVKFSFVVILLCLFGNLFSQQITEQEAKAAAATALQNFADEDGKSYSIKDNSISQTFELKDALQNTLIYEVKFDNGYTVMVSGNRECNPILGYFRSSEHSALLDTIDNPCCFNNIIKRYEYEIAYIFQNPEKNDYFFKEWDNLISGRQNTPSASSINIGPLLTTKWGQDVSNLGNDCIAYNYYVTNTSNGCTDCGNSKVCPAGCGAVAMAQILNYWKYPMSHERDNTTTYFDWCNMSDNLNTYSLQYIKERDAVAKLIYESAKTMHTTFCIAGICNSSAIVTNITNAFKSFGYSKAKGEARAFYHVKQHLIDNISAYRPVLYNGFEFFNNTHTFVVDGYRSSDDKFSFNWGWTGDYDGWYALSALDNKNVEKWMNWNIQTAVVNIYPDDDFDYCNYNVTLNAALFNGFKYSMPKTTTTLTIGGNYCNINSGENITYTAHKAIILKPGFSAKAGSNFTAKIEPCANCPAGSRHAPSAAPPKPDYQITENEITDGNTIAIYPNPTTGILNIQFENLAENCSVELFNTQGILMKKVDKVLQTNLAFDLSNQPQGFYFILVRENESLKTFKVIKQ